MKRITIAAATIAAVATIGATLGGAELAGGTEEDDAPQPVAAPIPAPAPVTKPACAKLFTQKKTNRRIRGMYQRDNITRKAKRRLEKMIKCQRGGDRARRNVRINRRHWKERWERLRSLTPFYCGKGNGWYATPCAVVECEGGYNGWNVMNRGGSGAYGPYQLLGWVPVPSPPHVQNKAAARLWNGGVNANGLGPSHWNASKHCWGGKV